MSRPRRGVDLPAIPMHEFVPRPARLTDRSAEWGVSVMVANGERYSAATISPADLLIYGAQIEWHSAANGTGVHYGRAHNTWGAPFAVARAVPLS